MNGLDSNVLSESNGPTLSFDTNLSNKNGKHFSGVNGTDINVVSGHSATLPCDTKRSSTREQPSLILWFKEEDGKPIFR